MRRHCLGFMTKIRVSNTFISCEFVSERRCYSKVDGLKDRNTLDLWANNFELSSE